MKISTLDSALYKRYSRKYESTLKDVHSIAVKHFRAFEQDLKKFIKRLSTTLQNNGYTVDSDVFAVDELVFFTGKKTRTIDIATLNAVDADEYSLTFSAVFDRGEPSVKVTIYENGEYLTTIDAISESTISKILL